MEKTDRRAAVIWSRDFLDYKWSPVHALNPIRLDLTFELASGLGVLDGVGLLSPEIATDGDLARIHSRDYISAVRTASVSGNNPAFGLVPPDNPPFDRMHETSALIAGGTLLAAQEIAAGHVDRAINLAGGLHHAMPDRASGFCVYNDCAIAISWLLDHGFRRIAYVDVDVHHGDGVQAAFLDDPRVLTISLHQHPASLWPGTGLPSEVGVGAAKGTSVNLALPAGTTDSEWLTAFHAVVPPLLAAYQPEILITQCGADSHVEDPLAKLALSVDGHRITYQALRDCARKYATGKWLALGGGGYSLFRVVPRFWTHLLAVVLDRDVDPQVGTPLSWQHRLAEVAPEIVVPETMTDDRETKFPLWDGAAKDPISRAIDETCRAVFPYHHVRP